MKIRRIGAVGIVCAFLMADAARGGIIQTNNMEVRYQQTIFADTFEGDTALAADVGGYASWLGTMGSIVNTTGASGAATDVLQVSKPSSNSSQPALRAYFTTTDPVDPVTRTLNFDQDYAPGLTSTNYIRISFDWKPVTGFSTGYSAYDSFSAIAFTESAPNVGTGQQTYMTGTYQKYNGPLPYWRLYARGASRDTVLTDGGRGEVYSTGAGENNLVPDGRWYHVVAEFSVPDASEHYEWSMAFTPYDGGVLNTAATATTGGSGTFAAGALYSAFAFAGNGGTAQYTWYVDNLQAEFLVLFSPQGTMIVVR